MEKEMKICLVVKCFLKNPTLSMQQLAELPELEGISKSSIQRYLNNPTVETLFGGETANKIQELLELKKISAQQKGGINSFLNNKSVKASGGKFVGSIKSPDLDRLKTKCRHIVTFAGIFLNYPTKSLQEIADFYNGTNPDHETVTKDYVYDCLSSKKQYTVLSEDVWKQIESQLEQRRLLGNKNGADITNKKK